MARFSIAQMVRDIPLVESVDDTSYRVNTLLENLSEVDISSTINEENVRVLHRDDNYYIESSELDRLATIYQDDPMVALKSVYEYYNLSKDNTYIVLESNNIYNTTLKNANNDTQINISNNLALIDKAISEGFKFVKKSI